MKALLPLALIPMLLLVGTARADDDIERLERDVRTAALGLELLLKAADETENPVTKAEILENIKAARAHWNWCRAALARRAAGEAEPPEAKEDPDAEDLDQIADGRLARLEEMLENLEAERVKLMAKVTNLHPAAQRVREKIRSVQAEMDRLRRSRSKMHHDEVRLTLSRSRAEAARADKAKAVERHVTGKEGKFTLSGVAPGTYTLDAHALHPQVAEKRAQLDHLRQAAHHLREAGALKPAEKIEREVRDLELQLEDELQRLATERRAQAAGEEVERAESVLGAIHGLRREVHGLRREVRELRGLLLRRQKR